MRISVTQMESFRWVMDTEYGCEAELIEAIKGSPFTPTWQMQGGTAWHTALESAKIPDEAQDDGEPIEVGPFAFRPGAIRFGRNLIGPGLFEVKGTKNLTILGQPVTMVAQADHVRGLVIQDNKTKFPSKNPPKPWAYDNNLQWRFYLWIHEAAIFRFNRFHFDEPYGGLCALRDVQTFKYFPFAGLHSECMDWLERFVDWAGAHKLWPYLEREGTSPNLPGED